MNVDTRLKVDTSLQVSQMGEIIGTRFSIKENKDKVFLIKNDGEEAIALSVRLASMPGDKFVTTVFDLGWNPELVAEVKDIPADANLKWGR